MIKYICDHCQGLEVETSICPVCGNRTRIQEIKIYWSKKMNTPSFEKMISETGEICDYLGTDVRPVFPPERLLMEVLLGKPFSWADKSVWVVNSAYFVDGVKQSFNFKDLMASNDVQEVIDALNQYKEENIKYEEEFLNSESIQNFIYVNKNRLSLITSEAIEYIQKQVEEKSLDEMFVSFSGGKDSTVTSDLVTKALGTKTVLHIYGDTTLEFPLSKEYIERFKKLHRTTPMLIAQNQDQDFNNMCETIGPPSRLNRWCCTVFKTGAITQKIEGTFKGKERILSFQGIRRNESLTRSKYERETESPKIAAQRTIAPIIDWLDFDVWLYILSNNLDFNEAYKQGFARVGCWCCPNNSDWSSFLAHVYMQTEFEKFQDILYAFAKKAGKPDWKNYVDSGNWKARTGGLGSEASENIIISFKPCALEENTYNFELNRPISEKLYTLFKPFGTLNFLMGKKRLNEVYVLNKTTQQPILRLSGRIGTTTLKISVIGNHPLFSNKQKVESLLRAQITKYQSCLACSGCQSACKFGALRVRNTKKGQISLDSVEYTIDESKCVGCMKCVDHYPSGCYMYKVLKTVQGDDDGKN